MFAWLYDVPYWVGALLFVVVLTGITWVGIFLSRHYVAAIVRREPEWDKVVGLILSAYGVFYGITLALVAVSTYQSYAGTKAVVSREASSLAALYRDVSSYPEPISTTLKADLRSYTRSVIDVEFPEQSDGTVPQAGVAPLDAFQADLFAFEPTTPGQEIVHSETISRYGTYVELRRQRIADVNSGLPGALWFLLAIGALLNSLLIVLFDIQRSVHLLVSGLITTFVALVVFTTVSLDDPFRGPLSVTSSAFVIVQESLMR